MIILGIIIWMIIGGWGIFKACLDMNGYIDLIDLLMILLGTIIGPFAWIIYYMFFGSPTIIYRKKQK